ncbi:zinc-binding alcohol dehydrogenase family protein [Phanerochaete sordida]|uniref:Zinc-binding alcohol dehydrogenase family protein n=1 Tax=Phanerochaete sordida TaxID=48140 RepID=A0A9P3G7V2_9APHY|nr:zinc-binding alcohol dehydrogenase family protein [Phanerochaete sordida]
MSSQKALFLLERLGKFGLGTNTIPEPAPGELLVEIRATALNPVDWKIQDHDFEGIIQEYPAILGTDSAGVVAKVGEGVTRFAVGDRVMHQGFFTTRMATFQQYTTVPEQLAAKIPPNLTFDEACTIPLTMATAAIGLYNKHIEPNGGCELSPPWEEGGRGKYAGQPFFVTGGSSSLGQHVIQFAKLSGFSPIITTASPRHEAALKALGATHVVDRATPPTELPALARRLAGAPVLVAFDAISSRDTQNVCYDVLARGGQVVLALPSEIEKGKLTPEKRVVEVFGNVHVPAQTPVGISLYRKVTELVANGDIKPNNVEVLPNGLLGIPDGLNRLKEGKVSLAKLVARPQETP